MQELEKDTKRKFVWSEISFFNLWWKDQGEEVRKLVRKLVSEKRLEFVGAGMSFLWEHLGFDLEWLGRYF
jgi:hypothetical protein